MKKYNYNFTKVSILIVLAACMACILTGCGCRHEDTVVLDRLEANCVSVGYSGDTYCLDCEKTIKKGEELPKTEHRLLHNWDSYEATCEYEGYTGDTVCETCWLIMEEGESIPVKEHEWEEVGNAVSPACYREGYTGDAFCLSCGTNAVGSVLPRPAHDYENHTCKECGWIEAGLYIDGEYVYTWEELCNSGYVTVEDGMFTEIKNSLYGTLAVGEDVHRFKEERKGYRAELSSFVGSKISEIHIPCTVPVIDYGAFSDSDALERVVIYGENVLVEERAFAGCNALRVVEAPRGIMGLKREAFIECSSLEEVIGLLAPADGEYGDRVFEGCSSMVEFSIPDGCTVIPGQMFKNCTALRNVVIPESVSAVGHTAFAGCTALTSVTLPESVAELGESAFEGCTSLECMNLAHLKITDLPDEIFYKCTGLKEIVLPQTLEYIESGAFEDSAIEHLDLPESLKCISEFAFGSPSMFSGMYANKSLRSIVWPKQLLDSSAIAFCSALEEVYFTGSELDWSLAGHAENFGDVAVHFNYVPEE